MPKQTGWEVELVGDSVTLKELSKSFVRSDYQIVEIEGYFHLRSDHFERVNEPKEIRKIATEFVSLLSGAARLQLGSVEPISVGGVARIGEDGSRSINLEVGAINVRARVFATLTQTNSNGRVIVSNPADPVKDWVASAQENPAIANVLELLNAEDQDWVNLYRIYELIEDDVGGPSEMARIGGVSKTSLERFTHTANSRKAAGIQSRHGVEKFDPPKNPMTLSEAQAMISKITKAWLNTEGGEAVGSPI